jgi:hypothetical protein
VAAVKLTSGVRYHVALCEEHLGHMVTALGDFTAAQAQAQADGAHDVLRLVGKHLDDLGPRVPRLTVRVVPSDVAATVKLDGVVLQAGSLGTPMPVDPGPHHLEASADASTPARAPAVADVTLKERDVTSLELALGEPAAAPAAAPVPAATTAPSPTPAPPPAPAQALSPSPAGNTRTGAIIATAGAAVLAAGGVLAFVLAGNAVGSGEQQCAVQRGPCDSEKNTVRAWDFTAAGAWIGAAGVGAIAVLLWMQPQTTDADGARATLVVGPTSAAVSGRF